MKMRIRAVSNIRKLTAASEKYLDTDGTPKSGYDFYPTDLNDMPLIYDENKHKFGLYDERNKITILEPIYDSIYDTLEEGTHYNRFCFKIKKGKEVGIVKDGKIILFPGSNLSPFTAGLSIITKGEFRGVVKEDGKIILPTKYKFIEPFGLIYGLLEEEIQEKFKKRCIFVAAEQGEFDRKSIFDEQGKQIVPPAYFGYDFAGTSEASKNLIEVSENDVTKSKSVKINYLSIKNNFKEVFKKSYIYTSLYSVTSDLIVYADSSPELYSIMDLNEKDLLNGNRYLSIEEEDLNDEFIRVRTSKGLNYLDKKNNFKLLSSKTYTKVESFKDGFAVVIKDKNPSNISSSVNGIINDKGQEILSPIYRGVSNFNRDGVGAFAIDYTKNSAERSVVDQVKVGLINKRGEVILPAIKYNSIWIEEGSTYIGAVGIPTGYQEYNYKTDQFFTERQEIEQRIDFLSKKDLRVLFTGLALSVAPEFKGIRLIKGSNYTGILSFSGETVNMRTLENLKIKLHSNLSVLSEESNLDTIVISNDSASGVISLDGKIILPIIYEEIKIVSYNLIYLTFQGKHIELKKSQLEDYGEKLINKIKNNFEEIELTLGFKPIIEL